MVNMLVKTYNESFKERWIDLRNQHCTLFADVKNAIVNLPDAVLDAFVLACELIDWVIFYNSTELGIK